MRKLKGSMLVAAILLLVATAILSLSHVYGQSPTPSITLPTATFSSSSYSVSEGGTISVSIVLDQSSTSTVTVDVSASGNDLSGEPYGYTGVVRFDPGETVKTMEWTIAANNCCQGNVTIHATLVAAANANLGSPSTATITILDDDICP